MYGWHRNSAYRAEIVRRNKSPLTMHIIGADYRAGGNRLAENDIFNDGNQHDSAPDKK